MLGDALLILQQLIAILFLWIVIPMAVRDLRARHASRVKLRQECAMESGEPHLG